MKILELRFKNLNSLRGEWVIDFTSDEYITEGIFAITGPTGAGKSTILDAICLALYGRTPRLPRVNKKSNEIMSRQTGECYAEVTFSTQNETLRCHWSQQKARKKATANLVDYKHEIANASTGQIIEAKKSLIPKIVEEKTGLDFERFTRAILLAQGSFDTFLKANSDARSPILEQITGTRIYSEISLKVHERKSNEEKQYQLLKAEIAGVSFLSQEKEEEIHQDLIEKTAQEATARKTGQETETALNWLATVSSLQRELVEIAKEEIRVDQKITEFEPSRLQLKKAINATELEGLFAALSEIRLQQRESTHTLQQYNEQLPTIKKRFDTQKLFVTETGKQLTTSRQTYKDALPLMRSVRALDLEASEKNKRIVEQQEEYAKIKKRLKTDGQRKETLLREQKKSTEQQKQLLSYFTNHSMDETLITELTGVVGQIKQIQSIINQGQEIRTALDGAEKQLEQSRSQQQQTSTKHSLQKEQHRKLLLGVKTLTEQLETLLAGRLLREYRAEYESLQKEISYLRKIADLETERQHLKSGKACPLCGSTTHPFALTEIPDATREEQQLTQLKKLILQIEQAEDKLKKLEAEEKNHLLLLTATEKDLVACALRVETDDKESQRLRQDRATIKTEFKKLQTELLTFLKPWNHTTLPKDLDIIIEELHTRQREWVEKKKEQDLCEKEETRRTAEIDRADANIKDLTVQLTEKMALTTNLKNELELIALNRFDLYQKKEVDAEEQRFETEIARYEQMATEASETLQQDQQKLTGIQTQIDTLKINIAKTVEIITSKEDEFASQCQLKGFQDEPSFLQSRIETNERRALEVTAQTLNEQKINIDSRKKDRAERLVLEQEKKLTIIPHEDLLKAHRTLQEMLKNVGEEIGALKQQISDNQKAKETVADKKKAVEIQQVEFSRWEKLHSLIGSSDGKKFRNFAQGLTFELMVNHANRQLEKMSDRYLLIRDDKNPLELNVIDNYQGGEERSTQNLSGGESFIVSLALALGLSNMASRKVRVDSLFLDEGFGTLDEEALETALSTLSGLQSDDKLIGIISHVPALKERIGTQIKVAPLSGGKSSITGPGCSSITADSGSS